MQIQFEDDLSAVAVCAGQLILAALHGVPCPVPLPGASHCWISSSLLCLLYRHHLLQQMADEGKCMGFIKHYRLPINNSVPLHRIYPVLLKIINERKVIKTKCLRAQDPECPPDPGE